MEKLSCIKYKVLEICVWKIYDIKVLYGKMIIYKIQSIRNMFLEKIYKILYGKMTIYTIQSIRNMIWKKYDITKFI